MEDDDHGECPVELLTCRRHHGGELQPESSIFASAIQMMLEDAGMMDEGDGGPEPEVKE